jgi:SAM-dependent methyltransferase
MRQFGIVGRADRVGHRRVILSGTISPDEQVKGVQDRTRRRPDSFYANPDLYDLIFGFRHIDREMGFISRVYEQHAGKPMGSLLDACSGTGAHVIEALRRGIAACGVDISPEMVRYASQKAGSLGYTGSFVVGDVTRLPVRGPFDCAICMFHSLPLLTDNERLADHFECVAGCLRDGGLYVVEMGNPMQVVADAPNSRRELWEERCWSEFRDGARIRGTSYRDPLDFRTETVRVEMIVDIAAPGVSIRISATETHRLLLPQSLAYIASSAGHMLLKEVYADFDLAAPYLGSRRSPRMICVFAKEHSPPPRRQRRRRGSEQLGLSLDP